MATGLELHHFFILVEPGAPEAKHLQALGLEQGDSRRHPGQGTSNKCFNFANGTLELLWIDDREEAINGAGRGLCLYERSRQAAASPFGLVLTAQDRTGDVPFAGWCYQPDYFEPPRAFHVGNNSRRLCEPLCIYMPSFRPGSSGDVSVKGVFACLSRVRLVVAATALSEELEAVNRINGLSVESGPEHLMEIVFNDNPSACSCDLRPHLPLILRY